MNPFKANISLILILVTVCQTLTFCSKRLHQQSTAHKAEINGSPDSGLSYSPDTDTFEKIERQSRRRLQEFKNSVVADTVNNIVILADKVLNTAKEYLGVPYCFGGVTPKCLDCSGFVRIVFSEYGIDLPHSAQEQSKSGTIIKDKKDLIKGDLLFFHGSYRTNKYITHSAIYTGDNRFIHASTGKGVTITSLDDPWWKGKFSFGTRILN